jgi:hypothetical protein
VGADNPTGRGVAGTGDVAAGDPAGDGAGVHVTRQCASREGVHADPGLLPDRHVRELGLLVVGNHPHVRQRREGRDLCANAHQLSGLHLALSEHTVLSGDDRRVLQVEARHDERGLSR